MLLKYIIRKDTVKKKKKKRYSYSIRTLKPYDTVLSGQNTKVYLWYDYEYGKETMGKN